MVYEKQFTIKELRDITKPRTWLRTRLVERTKFTPQLEAQLANSVMDKDNASLLDVSDHTFPTYQAYQKEVVRIRREIRNILYQ